MKEQLVIRFTDNHIRYQAEVKTFDLEGKTMYDVYYSLIPYVHPPRKVQVYAGSGNGPAVFWRQRITSREEELLPQEFVQAVGRAIELAEK